MLDPTQTVTRRVVVALSCLSLLVLPACYAYSPIEGGRPEAGDEVRLRLNVEGARRVGSRSFLERPEIVEGGVAEVSESGYRVVLTAPARRSFRAGGVRRDTVWVPAESIQDVEAKKLQTTRTVILIGGGTFGAFVLGAALASGAGGGGGGLPPGDSGGDVTILVPLRFP